MDKLPVLVALCLLLVPGCTYFDDSMDEESSEETTEPELISGCTDSEANNYDSDATEDDGSCEYDEPEPEPEPVMGCTDPDAMNHDSNATEDDGSCQYMETVPCNGMVILCHRTYDKVTFPETHNSYSTHEDNIFYPASNHRTGFQAQWNAGMRASRQRVPCPLTVTPRRPRQLHSFDVDDVGALCMAHALHDLGEARLLAVLTGACVPHGSCLLILQLRTSGSCLVILRQHPSVSRSGRCAAVLAVLPQMSATPQLPALPRCCRISTPTITRCSWGRTRGRLDAAGGGQSAEARAPPPGVYFLPASFSPSIPSLSVPSLVSELT